MPAVKYQLQLLILPPDIKVKLGHVMPALIMPKRL